MAGVYPADCASRVAHDLPCRRRPTRRLRLIEVDGAIPVLYLARAKWVALEESFDTLPDRELTPLVTERSQVVRDKLPAKTIAALKDATTLKKAAKKPVRRERQAGAVGESLWRVSECLRRRVAVQTRHYRRSIRRLQVRSNDSAVVLQVIIIQCGRDTAGARGSVSLLRQHLAQRPRGRVRLAESVRGRPRSAPPRAPQSSTVARWSTAGRPANPRLVIAAPSMR